MTKATTEAMPNLAETPKIKLYPSLAHSPLSDHGKVSEISEYAKNNTVATRPHLTNHFDTALPYTSPITSVIRKTTGKVNIPTVKCELKRNGIIFMPSVFAAKREVR